LAQLCVRGFHPRRKENIMQQHPNPREPDQKPPITEPPKPQQTPQPEPDEDDDEDDKEPA
jgi:hypothetical protein